MALRSFASRFASGAMGGAMTGTIFDHGMPGPWALGLGLFGGMVNAPWGELRGMGMLTGRQAAIHNRKMWDRTKAKEGSLLGRTVGAGLAGMVGGAIGGPLVGGIAAASVIAPKKMARAGAFGFDVAAGG